MTTLAESYATCKELNRRHGTTYYWATQILPAAKRPPVHALYGFCRYADDIVDDLGPVPVDERVAALDAYGEQFFTDLGAGDSDHPVLKAVVDTVQTWSIDPECFERFLTSMKMDFTEATYETYDDLCRYMEGSAAVIGEMMLPVLEPTSPQALQPARDLGLAFQLTNFLRDVGEDLDRGRVYLPQVDLRHFGADPWARTVTPSWIDLMRYEIDRTRRLYASADRGITFLPGRSGRCIRAARVLYSRILDKIEANGYDVFSRRARVPTYEKVAAVAGSSLRPT